MNIEIRINAESVEEARAAFAQLAGERPATHITVIPNDPRVEGGEMTIPAGTNLKIAGATRDSVTLTSVPTVEPVEMPEPAPEMPEPAPEKPKRKRVSKQAAEMLAESAQEAAGEPEAPQAATTPAEPEKPAEKPTEKPSAPVPTKDAIAAAGAKLLDADPTTMQPLLNLLSDYGVQAITQLKDDQLAEFAENLRALGAEV